ncbi:MAG: hypothetical protein ACOCXG_00530 [Nanoarchaeota archaeon]
MPKKIDRRKDINFLLENKEFRKLQLYLYLATIFLISIVYFLMIIIFSQYSPVYVTTLFSILAGIYLVFNRDKIVRIISLKMHEYKRKNMKKANTEGYKTTMRKIVPRNRKLKLNIGKKLPLKEKLRNLKLKLLSSKKNNKEKIEYIEFED